MQALTLTELAQINRAVDYIARSERVRLHCHREQMSDIERMTLDELHRTGLISLMPDEDEIRDRERRNMRADLMESYASRHRADETYRTWLIRIGNSGLRGERVDVARLYPELRRCEQCGCVDDPERSADRPESPHAKYCPVRAPRRAEPESVKSVRATVRTAGANELHRVIVTDETTGAESVVAERRSAHRYTYAICRWSGAADNRTVVVERWSRSRANVSYPRFPVTAERID